MLNTICKMDVPNNESKELMDFIQPLSKLTVLNTTIDHPFQFWKDRLQLVWQCYCALARDEHVIFTFITESSILRSRVHAFCDILLESFPTYQKKTMHKTKQIWNPDYESDSYDEVTDSWSCKMEPCHLTSHHSYISLYKKPSNPGTSVTTIRL